MLPTPVRLGTHHCIQSYAGAPLHAVRHRRARLSLSVDPVGRRDGRTALRLARPRRARRRPALHRRRGHAGLELRGERLRPRHVRPRVREPPRSAQARRWVRWAGSEGGRVRTVGAAAARTPGSSCRSICRTARSHRTGHGGPRRPSLRARGARLRRARRGRAGWARTELGLVKGQAHRAEDGEADALLERPAVARALRAQVVLRRRRRRRRQRHGGAGGADV